MREIKFRAWDGKGWTTLGMFNNMGDRWSGMKIFGISQHEGIILMQFTGLKDKNGVEIYEGDVIKYPASGGLDKIVKVVWNNGWLRFEGSGGYGFSSAHNIEIIGNIYEHPELLNK